MTPSLPTFFIASAIMLPTCLSVLALIVPTCAIMSPFTSRESLLIPPTATSTALSMPRLSAIGLAPAATVRTPSRKIACASTVAVVVPSPATSDVLDATSRTTCAPMFSSGSCNSISYATVTPSFVMIGAPNFFSITALRPFGPSVILTASARMLTPRKIACREFSPVTICFAIGLHPPGVGKLFVSFAILGQERLFLAGCRFGHSAESRQDFLFAEDQVFLVVDFDVASGVFAEQDPVANLHVEPDTAALFHLAR